MSLQDDVINKVKQDIAASKGDPLVAEAFKAIRIGYAKDITAANPFLVLETGLDSPQNSFLCVFSNLYVACLLPMEL